MTALPGETASEIDVYVPPGVATRFGYGIFQLILGTIFGIPMLIGGLLLLIKDNDLKAAVVMLALGLTALYVAWRGGRHVGDAFFWLKSRRRQLSGIWLLQSGILIRKEKSFAHYIAWGRVNKVKEVYLYETASDSTDIARQYPALQIHASANGSNWTYEFRGNDLSSVKNRNPPRELVDQGPFNLVAVDPTGYDRFKAALRSRIGF